MASSTVLPTAVAKPRSLTCKKTAEQKLVFRRHRCFCTLTGRNGGSLKVRVCPLGCDFLHVFHSSTCKTHNCGRKTSCYCRVASSFTAMSLLLSRFRGFCLPHKAIHPSSITGTARGEDKIRVRAVSSSPALSARKKEAAPSPPIVQPSLTWGIIPHPRESSQKVLDFLEGEGINTSELHDVELPMSVEVMRERLDFLKQLGLSLDTINSYPLMVTCSIKKNMVPVLDYLEQLGLKSRNLPDFVKKYPVILHSSVVIDLMPVIDCLLGLDIKSKDIAHVLTRYPDVLGFRLEGTISTSVAYLVGLGVRMRAIGRMLTEYPEILGMRVANTIKPKVDFLLGHGIPKDVIAKILEVRPYILGFDLDEAMEPAVDSLLEAGVRKEAMSAIITQYPDILGQNVKENLDLKTRWLVQGLKVEPSNVPIIIEKLPQILFIKEGLAMKRVDFLLEAGCSVDDVAKMVTGCPQILALSISLSLEPSLKFLLNDMKGSVKEVVMFPLYFTYDLKSRIMPRYKLVAKAGIECSLEWFLNCSEQKFKARLLADYIDNAQPGPTFQAGGVVFTETLPVEEAPSFSEPLQQTSKTKKPWESYTLAQAAAPLGMESDYDENDSESEFQFRSRARRHAHDSNDELDMSESPSEFDVDGDDDDEDGDDDEVEQSLRRGMRDRGGKWRRNSRGDIFSEEDDDYSEDIVQAGSDEEELDMSETASEFAAEESEEDQEEDGWVEIVKERRSTGRYR